MSAVELVFEEPPPVMRGRNSRGQSPLGLWLAALRYHPGVWAKYPEPTYAATAGQIRGGRNYGAVAGEFETRPVSITGSKPLRVTLYARYIGAAA
jgi:hypothetical protein